jgi:triacylglycerol lipase
MDSADARPRVVLVHGILDTGRIFRPLARALERHGLACLAPDLQPNHGGAPLERLAEQLAGFVEAEVPRSATLHLAGFSMGALVARHYIQHLRGSERVRRYFSIAAPNTGSVWCHLHPLAGARQMRPGSAFLRRLDADVSCFERIPAVAYWTPLDLVVVPPPSALAPFAENVRILSACHQCLLRHPQLHAHMARRMLSDTSAEEATPR